MNEIQNSFFDKICMKFFVAGCVTLAICSFSIIAYLVIWFVLFGDYDESHLPIVMRISIGVSLIVCAIKHRSLC